MSSKIYTKIHIVPRGGMRLYLNRYLVRDSGFPFKDGDRVTVRIENEKLIIEGVTCD